MKTILVPLDGSALAERVLPYVRLLAPLLEARVQLLRVISDADQQRLIVADDPELHSSSIEQPSGYQRQQLAWDILRQRAENYLSGLAQQLRVAGLAVEIDVRTGLPADGIAAAAEQIGPSMIAMVTHDYSGVRRWALGSVADSVIATTSTPLLLIHGSAPERQSVRLQRILVPLDSSTLADTALSQAVALARRTEAELLLLQAVQPLVEVSSGTTALSWTPPLYNEGIDEQEHNTRNQVQRELAERATSLRQLGVVAQPLALLGSPAETIVDEAVARHADMIVMATHGYGGLRRWALGSVADKVLHSSTTPMLLLRAKPVAG